MEQRGAWNGLNSMYVDKQPVLKCIALLRLTMLLVVIRNRIITFKKGRKYFFD